MVSSLNRATFWDTDISEAGSNQLKAAFPYTLIVVARRSENGPDHSDGWLKFLIPAGAICLTAIAASVLMFRSRRRVIYNRRWLCKLPIVAAAICVIGLALYRLTPEMRPIQDGDPKMFWLHACRIDVGVKDVKDYHPGYYLPRDGWFIYYVQGMHEQFIYRVPESDALSVFPLVVEKLRKAPAGALHPDVEQGFKQWVRTTSDANDATGLLVAIRTSRLQRLKQDDPYKIYDAVEMEEAEFSQRWHRIQRFQMNVVFEFCFLTSLVLLVASPWLLRWYRWKLAALLALLPVYFFMPYWLGYAQWTFTSVGPSGGILYPYLIAPFRGLPWTPLDPLIMRNIPQPLEPLSQTGGPMMGMTNFGGPAPITVAAIALAVGASVGLVGWIIDRDKKRRIARTSTVQ